jgi:hypothetical protein
MPTIPGAALPFPKVQMFDNNGAPAAGYKLYFYVVGTATPQDTYSDADLDISHVNTNPVVLDANGRATIYLLPASYKVVYKSNLDVEIWTQDKVQDIAAVQFNSLGRTLATGARNVTNGYTVIETDNFITVQSSAGPNPVVINLPAATRTFPIAIKNIGSNPLAITPNGSDTIEGLGAAYAVPAVSGALKPTVWLFPDGVSAWWALNVF